MVLVCLKQNTWSNYNIRCKFSAAITRFHREQGLESSTSVCFFSRQGMLKQREWKGYPSWAGGFMEAQMETEYPLVGIFFFFLSFGFKLTKGNINGSLFTKHNLSVESANTNTWGWRMRVRPPCVQSFREPRGLRKSHTEAALGAPAPQGHISGLTLRASFVFHHVVLFFSPHTAFSHLGAIPTAFSTSLKSLWGFTGPYQVVAWYSYGILIGFPPICSILIRTSLYSLCANTREFLILAFH